MSYTPTDWKTGDIITAEKLNNMEDGIVGGQELFIIHATGVATQPGTPTTPVLDKTYEEIADAIQHGKIPFVVGDAAYKPVYSYSTYIGGVDAYLFGLTIIQGDILVYMSVGVTPNECMSEYSQYTLPTNSTNS